MRDADRRQLEHAAEVEREADSARVVAAGRVHEQHVGRLWKGPDNLLEQPAFA